MTTIIRTAADLPDERMIDSEWRKCRKSLLYYLTHYVHIQDRTQQAIITWQPWAHLVNLVRLVQEWADRNPRLPLFILIFKSRQVGASTTITAIGNWLVAFFESSKVLFQSENERVALEMLERARFINQHHPSFLRLKMFPNQDDLLGFPATNGKIKTLPSTEEAGRETDATMVVPDEWERFHGDSREGFASIKPSIDRGGLFIGCSTVDKTKMDSFPKQVWFDAKKGINGFIPLFWDYFVVPGRTEETYQRDTKGLPDWRRESEYPRNEKEALSAPKAQGFFQHEILEKMLTECRDPVETRYGGKVRIFVPSTTSRRFAFAIDPSEGQEDPSVGVMADAQTAEDVACFNGMMSLDEQAKICFELIKEYNLPLLAVERNACGLTLIEKLNNLALNEQLNLNWYYSDKERKKPGWYTGSYGLNRERILNEFAEEVHLRRKRIPVKDCVMQMFKFAWINGRPEAVRGAHDDWIICEAILGQLLKNSSRGGISFSHFKYKEG